MFISHSTSIRPRVGRVDLARVARGRDRCPGFLAVLGVTGMAVTPSADVTTLGAATARLVSGSAGWFPVPVMAVMIVDFIKRFCF